MSLCVFAWTPPTGKPPPGGSVPGRSAAAVTRSRLGRCAKTAARRRLFASKDAKRECTDPDGGRSTEVAPEARRRAPAFGRGPPARRRRTSPRLTELVRRYLVAKEASGRSPATVDCYRVRLARLVARLGDRPLTRIRADDLRAWLLTICSNCSLALGLLGKPTINFAGVSTGYRARARSPVSARRTYACLRTMRKHKPYVYRPERLGAVPPARPATPPTEYCERQKVYSRIR